MQNENRRDWLKLCLAAAGASALPALTPVVAGTAVQRMRAIPSSGEQIPVIGLGTARTFDVGRSEDELAPLRDVMSLFLDNGGTLVDSSPMYGQAERVVGDLVSSLDAGKRVFFATKVWTSGQNVGMQQMEESFSRMGTGQIDLMQVHNLVDTRTQLNSIRELIENGRVRYVGITHYTASAFDALESWIKQEKLDYVQFPYSIVNREAERRLLPVAGDHGVAAIAHRNFEKGSLFRKVKGRPLPDWASEFDCASWGNFFLKYVLGDPRITNVIPATTKTKHLLDNMNAGLGRLPDADLRRRMVELIQNL